MTLVVLSEMARQTTVGEPTVDLSAESSRPNRAPWGRPFQEIGATFETTLRKKVAHLARVWADHENVRPTFQQHGQKRLEVGRVVAGPGLLDEGYLQSLKNRCAD